MASGRIKLVLRNENVIMKQDNRGEKKDVHRKNFVSCSGIVVV